ncbi:hypothetical protein EPUS_08071 [Endocarpon pusillum Z07020]|uniref:Apple domain-containing protein n=1 Tax=Endocarpon pusillum (strain Z07020 / HMAS-L-300199) TaxID=1263415 RepID=U1GB34_ENDPU|nr:uncharacterized protein EPUS_08071 [Endocarpon pusillum Z07020]ERF68911.1 hypothetical protein EPUS_08071 [Endocarpon pusillum Z07020]
MFRLMLTVILLLVTSVGGSPHVHKHQHKDKVIARATTSTPDANLSFFPGPVTPCSGPGCATAGPPSSRLCPANNDTAWTGSSTAQDYTVICDIDFPATYNIYPFVLAGSFEECMAQCESFNAKRDRGEIHCEGFVFAPGRVLSSDDCYLKSSLDHPSSATISLIGTPSATPAASSSSSVFSPPKFVRSQLHGASVNHPTTKWVYHEPAKPMKLEDNLLKPGINVDLITKFDIASDTGPLTSALSPLNDELVDLSVVPHISRDGGKGGELNGHHLFIFCDTASFTTTNETHKGDMVGFTSSSVAVDEGWNGISGNSLSLVDGIGQWNDDVGRMRGFSPMTHGEESFNIVLSGGGYRYAVWPTSSIISLNKTHAIQYASLIYDEVNMFTQEAKFTALGNTLLTISVDEHYGPTAERTVKQMFSLAEVKWGTIGGIRSWGSEGIGGMDGKVYLFGQAPQGVLVARTDPSKVADKDSFEYWAGSTWTSGQLPPTATSFLIEHPIMDFDLFYSPYHKTFIMVYLTPHGDNTFYYRSLQAPHPIIPAYTTPNADIPDYDYVSEILLHPWSEEQTLYKAAIPPSGNFIYAGGVHAGYFGDEDITKGGKKMLISWTEQTGEDANTPKSGYAHMTAGVEME